MLHRVERLSLLVSTMCCYSTCFGLQHLLYQDYECDEGSISQFGTVKPLRLVETAAVTSRVQCVKLCGENKNASDLLLALVYQSSGNLMMTCCLLTVLANRFREYQITADLQDSMLTPLCNLYFPQGQTCETLQGEGQRIAWINLWPNHRGVPAVCDFSLDGSGWTVIQRRKNGKEDFLRSWEDYKTGFGSLEGEFWFGLENIRAIVDSQPHAIRFDMETGSGMRRYAVYQNFWFDVESNNYRMRIGSYSGNAGDSFSYHNNTAFDAIDKMPRPSTRCPEKFKSGFWFGTCHHINPNGLYGNTEFGQGIIWRRLTGNYKSLVFIEMKIKPMS